MLQNEKLSCIILVLLNRGILVLLMGKLYHIKNTVKKILVKFVRTYRICMLSMILLELEKYAQVMVLGFQAFEPHILQINDGIIRKSYSII